MSTIAELEKWLVDNCYSFNAISIGSHMASEGFVVEAETDKIWNLWRCVWIIKERNV